MNHEGIKLGAGESPEGSNDHLARGAGAPEPLDAEQSYESVLSGLEAQIKSAPEGAVIFVGALQEWERERSLDVLAENKGVVLYKASDGLGALPFALESKASAKTVLHHDDFLKELVFGSKEAASAQEAEVLFHHADNPADIVRIWLEAANSKTNGQGNGTIDSLLQNAVEKIRSLFGTRPVFLDLPTKSPLGLALVTFARTGTLTADAVSRIYDDRYPTESDRIATVTLDGAHITTYVAGEQRGSREIYG